MKTISLTAKCPDEGIKYHLKANDTVTVKDCFQYLICEKLQIDSTATFNINTGAQLIIKDGILCNDGTLNNDGEIIFT